ncbi:MAG: uroporphyrinogen-III C-methyltransferase [Candidatus Omnitrophica bacterium]|nr:uroporphyrinogen-III C-methyltransferase [Candidatus Omnitrophota bacterium]
MVATRAVDNLSPSTFRLPPLTKGIVYLVGAGPGDPKLITVRGLELLKRAHVVIYDHLVSERLVDFCQPATRRIYAGKEKARHAKTQDEINRLLVSYAKAGKTVVRLKGGDPILFGRGGEEALALAQAKMPYEIVPGVTSAIAVPAYAGIPVTHRQLSSSLAIVTGHEDPSKPDTVVAWDKLATATDTIVCLMGVGALAQTAARLIRHGRANSTPCAVIEWGTWPQQRTVVGTLATIATRCETARIVPPAVVVVGDVVRLRERLAWVERKPLFGTRIAVTRASDRAEGLAELLEDLGAEVIRLPAIELTPVKLNGLFDRTMREIDQFDWVFFTSPEGIHWFQRLLQAHRKDLRILSGRHIGAIGPRTAASIQQLGIHVDFVPRTFSQDGMLRDLKPRALAGKRALILSALESREALEQGLKRQGLDVVRMPIYQTTVPASLTAQVRRLMSLPIDLVTVTSASCVDHLIQALRTSSVAAEAVRRLRFASIGPVTSEAVRRHGGRVTVEASTSTIEGLVEAIVEQAGRRRERRGRQARPAPRGGTRQRGGHRAIS